MKIIGLTGPSGAGKGSLARELVKMGAEHIDTDAVYHELTSRRGKCTLELAERFGSDVLKKDGSLDRRALAAKVFCGGEMQEKRLRDLNRITHKYVIEESGEMLKDAAERGCRWAIVDAPLLIEAKMDRMCDCVVAVIAQRDRRLERIIGRDGISREAAEKRIDAQKELPFYMSHADYVIENNGSEDELGAKAAALLLSIGE